MRLHRPGCKPLPSSADTPPTCALQVSLLCQDPHQLLLAAAQLLPQPRGLRCRRRRRQALRLQLLLARCQLLPQLRRRPVPGLGLPATKLCQAIPPLRGLHLLLKPDTLLLQPDNLLLGLLQLAVLLTAHRRRVSGQLLHSCRQAPEVGFSKQPRQLHILLLQALAAGLHALHVFVVSPENYRQRRLPLPRTAPAPEPRQQSHLFSEGNQAERTPFRFPKCQQLCIARTVQACCLPGSGRQQLALQRVQLCLKRQPRLLCLLLLQLGCTA